MVYESCSTPSRDSDGERYFVPPFPPSFDSSPVLDAVSHRFAVDLATVSGLIFLDDDDDALRSEIGSPARRDPAPVRRRSCLEFPKRAC